MPVFKSGEGNAPGWCELEDFELIHLSPDVPAQVERKREKEVFLVCQGRINLVSDKSDCNFMPGGWINLRDNADGPVQLRALYTDALVFRAIGRWSSVTSAGLFDVWTTTPPDFDTPCDYKKTTRFDNHYHDFDEYWVVYEGEATVASEGKLYEVGPGDCIATGMGWHHDVVSLKDDEKKMHAVYFESGLEAQGRTGHLWEPKHGKAEPQLDRV